MNDKNLTTRFGFDRNDNFGTYQFRNWGKIEDRQEEVRLET